MCNRDGHCLGSSPDAASLGNSVRNSSGSATLTPESCWCYRLSTSSTSTGLRTRPRSSGSRACSLRRR